MHTNLVVRSIVLNLKDSTKLKASNQNFRVLSARRSLNSFLLDYQTVENPETHSSIVGREYEFFLVTTDSNVPVDCSFVCTVENSNYGGKVSHVYMKHS